MDIRIIYYIIFLGLISSALVKLYYSLKIQHLTKGGSKGWHHLAMYGIVSAVSYMIGFIEVVFLDVDLVTGIATVFRSFFMLMMAYYITSAFVRFLDDFKVGVGIFKLRWIFSLLGLIFLALLLINIRYISLSHRTTLLLTAISYLILAFSLIIISIPAFKMSYVTKKKQWTIAAFGFILAGLSLVAMIYTDGCCVSGGEYCSPDRTYVSIIPGQACSENMQSLNIFFSISVMVTSWISVVAYAMIWKAFQKILKG